MRIYSNIFLIEVTSQTFVGEGGTKSSEAPPFLRQRIEPELL